jgi:hypothetical protein
MQRRQQYEAMCGAEDETRGDEAIQLHGASSKPPGIQGEDETNGRGPVEKAVVRLPVGIH